MGQVNENTLATHRDHSRYSKLLFTACVSVYLLASSTAVDTLSVSLSGRTLSMCFILFSHSLDHPNGDVVQKYGSLLFFFP